jgi:DNA-binding transcriptional MerR regulator
MNASEVAKRADIGKDTLRYYEKLGLITSPPRSANGYRNYPPTILDELRFIKLGQSVGFTLNEIKPAIPFLANPDPGCPLLTKAIESQIDRVNSKIEELEQSKATLERWRVKLAEQAKFRAHG